MALFERIAYVEVTTNTGASITIRDLRIIFEVKKIEGKDPNTSTIEIFNLAEQTRNTIRDLGKNITLFAGYVQENGAELLFTGDITSISHIVSKPDVITRIDASDGKASVDKAKISISQAEKTSGRLVLERILAQFDIGNNLTQITFENKTYQSGYAFTGSAKQALNSITKFLNLTWSVQNNEIKLIPFDSNDNTGIILVSPTSGLIGSPQRLAGESRKAKGLTKALKPGWRIHALLLPSVNPLGRIALQSNEVETSTEFVVNNVLHNGDTHGRDWNSSIEVRE